MSRTFFKNLCIFLLCAAVFLSCGAPFSFSAKAEEPETSSAAAIIINADTGLVLYEKNSESPIYCGFLPRLMTCILLVESGLNLDEEVTLTSKMLEAAPEKILDGSAHVFSKGATITLRDLMKACLVANSQEAAAAIALTVCNDMTDFIIMMNEKARSIKAKNTRFVNVTGYCDDAAKASQYTTAYDISLITAYASSLNYIQEYSDKSYVDITVKDKKQRLYTKNSLVDPNSQYYCKKASGIAISGNSKTGYALSTAAIKTATKDSPAINFICSAYNISSVSSLYADITTLINHALTEYSPKSLVLENAPVAEIKVKYGKQEWLTLYAKSKVAASLPSSIDIQHDIVTVYDLPHEIEAPVTKGTSYGTVTYIYNGDVIGMTDLCAVTDISIDSVALYTEKISMLFANPIFITSLVVAALLIIAYSILAYVKNKQRMRERKRRSRSRVHPSITKK